MKTGFAERHAQRGDLVNRYRLAPLRLSEAFLDRSLFVFVRVIKFALARFQRAQHLGGIFLPVPRPSQNPIKDLFYLIFRHGWNYIMRSIGGTHSRLATAVPDARAGGCRIGWKNARGLWESGRKAYPHLVTAVRGPRKMSQ